MGKVGYDLAKNLNDAGLLIKFIVSSKGKHSTQFPSASSSIFSRLFFKLFRLIDSRGLLSSGRSRYVKEIFFDITTSFQITKDCRYLVSTNVFMPRTFERAKANGALVIIIPGNPEESVIRSAIYTEAKRYGVVIDDPYTHKFRYDEYTKAMAFVDRVVCFSNVIANSYKQIFPNTSIDLFPAILKKRPIKRDDSSKRDKHIGYSLHTGGVRFGYVAHTVLLKGLHILLRAWNEIDSSKLEGATLTVAGSIDNNVSAIISNYSHSANSNAIKFLGPMMNINPFYEEIDVLIVPSLIDGSPLTILEALERSIPVVATSGCGYSSYIIENINGHVCEPNFSDLSVIISRLSGKKSQFPGPFLSPEQFYLEDLSNQIVKYINSKLV